MGCGSSSPGVHPANVSSAVPLGLCLPTNTIEYRTLRPASRSPAHVVLLCLFPLPRLLTVSVCKTACISQNGRRESLSGVGRPKSGVRKRNSSQQGMIKRMQTTRSISNLEDDSPGDISKLAVRCCCYDACMLEAVLPHPVTTAFLQFNNCFAASL